MPVGPWRRRRQLHARDCQRTSWFGLVIQASQVVHFPRLTPMIKSKTLNQKNIPKLCGRMTRKTQKQTMCPWSATLMRAVFVYALYPLDGFWPDIFHTSPRGGTP